MSDEQEKTSAADSELSANYGKTRDQAKRRRRIAIARLLRPGVRRNGEPLSNVALAARVRGATVAEVKEVRAEIEANGVLQDELDHPEIERESR